MARKIIPAIKISSTLAQGAYYETVHTLTLWKLSYKSVQSVAQPRS